MHKTLQKKMGEAALQYAKTQSWEKIVERTDSRDVRDVARVHIRIALEDAAQALDHYVRFDPFPPQDTTRYRFSYDDGRFVAQELTLRHPAVPKNGAVTAYDIIFDAAGEVGVCWIKEGKKDASDGSAKRVHHSLDPHAIGMRLLPLEWVRPIDSSLVPIVVMSPRNIEKLERYASQSWTMYRRFQQVGIVVPFYADRATFQRDIAANLR